MRQCSVCGEKKPLEDFPRHKDYPDGRFYRCKLCHNAATKASREKHGGARRYHFRRRYGIEPEEFDAIVAAQGGKCAICRVRVPTHLDHDHKGKAEKHRKGQRMRGALCVSCNNGLGLFQDDPARLRRAAAYLEGGE